MLQFYSIFHLNLAYSSIEEKQRPEVIQRCYWPLLRLAREYNLPFGIEATGYTLETIAAIDPDWISELRRLTCDGTCEFIGSGYAQIIGPLVPADVNAANLRLGNQVYEQLLGVRPDIALVNEQAYSAGLVRHYIDAGYRAIAMEWDNPFRCHPEWNPAWRYFPQIACGQHGEEIPLIWNNAIAFQKFQRYAHGEMELAEYLEYLCGHHLSDESRVFSLYGNDVEIFDFRPGRYYTEASLHEDGEWHRIDQLFEALLSDNRFRLIRPSQALDLMELPGAGNRLHLESPEQPIPVKKQEKYNITRWAVTGRDDLCINTACWRIFESIKANPASNDDDWRELCYLWSSDFRTHITEKRWKTYSDRINRMDRINQDHESCKFRLSNQEKPSRMRLIQTGVQKNDSLPEIPPNVHVERDKSYLTVETDSIKIRLNCRRGLAIDALWFKNISEDWLCGTMHHGYYDDINWGADYYTGHLVLESPGHRRITDLEPVESVSVTYEHGSESIRVQGKIRLDCGDLYKSFRIYRGEDQTFIDIDYQLDWQYAMIGSLRLGYITINPEAFSQPNLFYATHNGGNDLECFKMTKSINYGDAVSFLVSAKHGLGCTGSVIKIGDHKYHIAVIVDKSASALHGMINYQKIGNSYICRLIWSAREMDDTSRTSDEAVEPLRCSLRVSATWADITK